MKKKFFNVREFLVYLISFILYNKISELIGIDKVKIWSWKSLINLFIFAFIFSMLNFTSKHFNNQIKKES